MVSLHFLLAVCLQLAIIVRQSDGAFCRRPVDIAFAIDASGSVGSWGYYQEKIFVRNTIARFGISRSGTHAAVIVYSTSANVAISLTQYTSYSRFYYAVQRIPYTRGVTRIDLALKVAAEQVFSEDGGVRSNVPKILVLMTDGFQTRTRDSLPLDKAVLPLKSQGVQVYALAIGHYTKTYELRLIVDKSSHIFRSSRFSGLSGVIGRLAVTTCRNALPMAFAIYPLNKQTRGRDLSARRAPTGYLSSVTSAVGPYGRPGGSFYLQGTSNSYIDFSNAASGKLDTWSAISIFLWVYPEEKPGPIVNYQRSGHGLGLWMSGTRVLEGRVYSRRNYYRRKLFFTHFLPRRWYYVGLMYDNNHGYATLWVNGRVVFRTRMNRIHLATQHPIRMGSVRGVNQYFKGRVTCLQIYGMMLNSNQIATIKKKCAARDQKDPCLSSPCKNGGSCIVDSKVVTGYRCRCKPGYRGHRCEVKPTRPTGRPTGIPTTRPAGISTTRQTGIPTTRPTGRPTTRLTGPAGRSIPTTHAGKPTTPSGTGRVTTPGVISNIDGFRVEVVEFINRFRRLHGAGPLILSTRISLAAQNWAQTLISRGTASIDPNTGYGTNVFTKIGAQTGLAQTTVVTWYTSVKHYDWARRQLKVLALPFIHLIWLSSNFVGVGLSRSPTAKFFVVVYFDPMPGNKPPSVLKENVLPYTDVFILLQSSIVSCNPGYTNEGGTCYKYHPDKQTWDGALFQSAKENSTLISLHKTSEDAFVQKLVPTGKTGLMWTGLNDLITEGTYTWSDGSSVEYTSWKVDEPTGPKEDCVGIEVSSYGTMSDAPCTEPHNYISRQPLEGLITYRVKLQLVSLLWTDDYSQTTTLSYMELKQKIETLLLDIFKIDTTFVSGYVEEFTKNTKPHSQATTKPTKSGLTTPGSHSTTSPVSAVTGRPTGRPTTRPTLFSTGTTQAATPASKPTSSGTSNEKPTVTVSTILKFGPGVTPDPTKPLQDHLRKNLGRFSAPLNQKSLIQSVRIIHPGVPPAVLGTCASSCLTTCVVSCNPFCCNSKIVANNFQYTGMRHAVIAQAVPKGLTLPRLFKYPISQQGNMFPVQTVAPQARPVTVPVTLSVRCVATPQSPCPPGTQDAQTIRGSYKMPQLGMPRRVFQPQPRPVLVQPLVLPGAPVLTPRYFNRMAIQQPRTVQCIPSVYNSCPPQMNHPAKQTKVTDPPQHIIHLPPPQIQSPCVPSAYNPCPPLMNPPVKTAKVIDPPQHIIHLPAPQMQQPCIPSVYKPCPPLMNPPVKTAKVTDPPQHIIHLPPPQMQPPCIPSSYNPCPPVMYPPVKTTKITNPPQHIIHLPPPRMQPPCIVSAFNSCPPAMNPPTQTTKVVDPPQHVIHLPPAPPAPPLPPSNFFPMPLSVPVLCIPRPFYPCPPMAGARKLSKPSHKKGKSRAVMPKAVIGSYPVPYRKQPYWQRPFTSYASFAPPVMPVSPLQRPAQYIPRTYGFRTAFQWYHPPVWPQAMGRPAVMSPLVPKPQRQYPTVMKPFLNDNPKQKTHRPTSAKGPISLKGSILVYPKPVPAIPPSPPVAVPCIPSINNPCLPFRPYSPVQNSFSVMKPCIPSSANPCLPNIGNMPLKPPTKPEESEAKPILLTRPLQVQGSVYFNFRPPPQVSGVNSPAQVPCIPTATTPCSPLMPPRQPFMPSSYGAPKVLNPFYNLKTSKVPQPATGSGAPALVNPNVAKVPPAAPHSIIVQLPEISLQAAPASSLPSPIIPPPQPHTPAFPSNCPVSCTHFPGVFCPPYCASYCCKNRGGNRKNTKKEKKEKKEEVKKGGKKANKKTKKQKSILKVKKTKKG